MCLHCSITASSCCILVCQASDAVRILCSLVCRLLNSPPCMLAQQHSSIWLLLTSCLRHHPDAFLMLCRHACYKCASASTTHPPSVPLSMVELDIVTLLFW